MIDKKIELLAPVGDFECLKAAIQNGADSVYLGTSNFNARQFAKNFNENNLEEAIIYAKTRNVNVHLVLNILIKNNEFESAFNLAKKAYELGIDAIIVQDLGLAKILINAFPDLAIHASTQLTIHNLEMVKILENLGFKRAVLSRELSLNEIEYICKNSKIEIETFIHGALCVSYSGQCLFSSMIGGRSGNRGKCAGTCRLPYKLIEEEKTNIIDSGYLLSTKDLCGLNFLPNLIKAGVMCFKIEGRMKSPEYVATVTRIYRKYIDKILNNSEYIIEKNDLKDLMLAFNRGGFSDGFLKNTPNKNLVYKEKPNHMGIYLGKINNYNTKKGYITFKTEDNFSIGDKILIDDNGISNIYNVTELMIKNNNIKNATKFENITIGRMKGNIKENQKIYLFESKKLSELSTNSYQNVENIKIQILATLNIKKEKEITIEAKIKNSNISYNLITNIIPEIAQNTPINKERIIEQFNKTKNTIFEFNELHINLDENLFLTIKTLNDLRREILEILLNKLIQNIKRTSNITFNNYLKPQTNTKTSSKLELKHFSNNNLNLDKDKKATPNISLLLNLLHESYNYLNLENITRLYIPFKYFVNTKFKKLLLNLSKRFEIYIYMPTIIKTNYINLLNLNINSILNDFNIKGAIISNLGEIKWFLNKDIELIGNYTLNTFNNWSIELLKSFDIQTFTISPETDKELLISLLENNYNSEVIVYGKTPVMTSNYCVLGKTNKCYKECNKKCQNTNKYYLRDRMNLDFRIIPDNIDTISTIYNSKTIFIDFKNFNIKNLRIDILDENIEEINNIIKKIKNGERLEGKNYTNGNLNRTI